MTNTTKISEGELYDFVLGACSNEDANRISKGITDNPKLLKDVDETVAVLAKLAMSESAFPPSHLKNKISNQLDFSKDSLIKNPIIKIGFWRKYAIAASVLFLISLAYNIVQVRTIEKDEVQIAGLKEAYQQMASETSFLKTKQGFSSHVLAIFKDEKTKMVRMNGTDFMPDGKAMVVWNPQTKEVLVDVKQLTPPPINHQHQLWALINGEPINLGVFDKTGVEELQSMNPVEKADAFAVTLEKIGGSKTPTFSRTCVIGNV